MMILEWREKTIKFNTDTDAQFFMWLFNPVSTKYHLFKSRSDFMQWMGRFNGLYNSMSYMAEYCIFEYHDNRLYFRGSNYRLDKVMSYHGAGHIFIEKTSEFFEYLVKNPQDRATVP